MSSAGKVLAIYHKYTREVLGYIPLCFVEWQTNGYRNFFTAGWGRKEWEVEHSMKGIPIKIFADDQGEADLLMRSFPLSWGNIDPPISFMERFT